MASADLPPLRRSQTDPAKMAEMQKPLLSPTRAGKVKVHRAGSLSLEDHLVIMEKAKKDKKKKASPTNLVAGGNVISAEDTPVQKEDGDKQSACKLFMTDLSVACFAVFLGAADGLSLGGLLFPHDKDHPNTEYVSIGMSMGLLTAFISNFFALLTSQFPHAVGGGVLTVVPIMSTYFKTWGPENCATIMVAVPIMTATTGILTYLVGMVGIQDILKVCPFVVFGGFIAGTGVQLLEFSLSMMYPKFETFLSLGPDGLGAMLEKEFWMFTGAGIFMAIFMFFFPRFFPNKDTTFLLIQGTLVLGAAFYVMLFACGISMDEARASGWLFDVEIPSKPDFYQVWTKQDFGAVNWDLIISPGFLLCTIQVFLMGTLTTTKNIYGTAEMTHTPVDFNREVRSAGIQTFCCGLFGAIPGNLVMSYSVTAWNFGITGRRFAVLLASISLAFFFVGDYCIAVLPKMIPACVLFWLGILLSVYWVWDAVGSVTASEHGIVVMMILVDMVLGPGPMIMLGVILVLVLSAKRLVAIDMITEQTNIAEMRSDVLRTGGSADALWKNGERTLILKLASGYFSFLHAQKVLDTVTEHTEKHPRKVTEVLFTYTYQEHQQKQISTRLEEEQEKLSGSSRVIVEAADGSEIDAPFEKLPATSFPLSVKMEPDSLLLLVLNMEGIEDNDTTMLNMMEELRSFAARNQFHVVLAGCKQNVEESMVRFGIPVQHVVGNTSVPSEAAEKYADLEARASQLAKQDASCDNRFLLVGDLCENNRCVSAYTLALEFCEVYLIAEFRSTNNPDANPSLARRTAYGEKVDSNLSMQKVQDLVIRNGGVNPSDPALPILVDIHCWLNGFYDAYDIKILKELSKIFTVRDYGIDEDIYNYETAKPDDWKVSRSSVNGPAPPLVWLLEGEIEHIWAGHKYELSHFRKYEKTYNLHENQRIEKMVMSRENKLSCCGYFQTSIGFYGGMMHAGVIKAVKQSKCILLERKTYQELCGKVDILTALNIYINKKRFVLAHIRRSGFPGIQM